MSDRGNPLANDEVPWDRGRGGNFDGDRHALYVGWVAMRASLAGLNVRVLDDGNGFFIPKLAIRLPTIPNHREFELVVVVPPPPEDWVLDD